MALSHLLATPQRWLGLANRELAVLQFLGLISRWGYLRVLTLSHLLAGPQRCVLGLCSRRGVRVVALSHLLATPQR